MKKGKIEFHDLDDILPINDLVTYAPSASTSQVNRAFTSSSIESPPLSLRQNLPQQSALLPCLQIC